MTTIVVTAPATEPVTLTLAKQFLRETGTGQDALIESVVIPAARQVVETYLQRALITRTLRQYRRTFPYAEGCIDLLYPPVASVTHVKYYDDVNVLQTLSSALYQTDLHGLPPRVALVYGETWPTTYLDKLNAVEIEYIAGYGATFASLPSPIVMGMLVTLATMYEYREALISGTIIAEVPESAKEHLFPYRVLTF